ncbi:MAG: ATP-binding protein [Duganella sp.]
MVPPSLYEAVFNTSPTGSYLLSPSPEAIILAVNDTFLKACGRRREDLVGVSLFQAFPSNPDDPNDRGEQELRDSLARALATGQCDSLPAQRYPIRVETPDGNVRYEERFWSAVSTPISDAAGHIVCIAHCTTDVTEQVRSQSALRQSEIRFRALVNAAADVVYRMSPDWQHMHELDGRGFLKTTDSLAEYRIADYVHPSDLGLARAAIDTAIRTRSVFELEHRVLRADGSHGWTYSRAVPLLDADGGIIEWIGSASDITQRKAAEEKLQEASRRKDDFLAMLAHELRNPLAPIKSAAQLLQLGVMDGERLRNTCQIIDRQVAHMTNLVDELLDVSRVARNLVDLDCVPLDLAQVVTDAVEQICPQVRARGQDLQVHLAAEPALVAGDKKRLVQILANLLGNAAKFTQEGGALQLRTAVRATHIRIEVIDNGVGMTADTVRHAFDLFSQSERSSDRSLGGLGLGLALVKSLVDLHGGSVSCHSAGLGLGSTFTVDLPRLAAPDATTDAAPSAGGADAGNAPGLRILVVDDNEDAADILAMLLQTMGHEAVVEYGSEQALARVASYRPQVCLLDIGLPGMDGNALAQHLRARPDTARSALIAVTGYGQESDRALSLAAGFDDHLVKPVDIAQLGAVLAAAAQRL